jgi:hypothetical protein
MEHISLVLGFSRPLAAVRIPMSFKSVFLGYARAFLCWVSGITLLGILAAGLAFLKGDLSLIILALVSGTCAGSSLLLGLSYVLARAGPAREEELLELVGLEESLEEVIVIVSSYQPLDFPRGDLEDDIQDLLGGSGKVQGGSSSPSGWNIEIALAQGVAVEECLNELAALLREWRVARDTHLEVFPPGWDVDEPSQWVRVFEASKERRDSRE